MRTEGGGTGIVAAKMQTLRNRFPRVIRLIAGVACAAAVVVIFGMMWVHADWTTADRLVHAALAAVLAACAYACLRRGRGSTLS